MPGSGIGDLHLDFGFSDQRGLDRHPAGAGRAVLHRVHSIYREIEDHLLQLNVIGTHRKEALGLVDAEHHASLRCLGLEDVKRRSNHVVDVELLQFVGILLFHQPTEVPDDLRRAPIVVAYVGEDLPDPLDIRRVGLEKELRSLGIALDRAERLVELMRDGSRQRARGRGAVEVNDFQQPPAQFLLRDPAAAMLEQQPRDQRGLQKNDRKAPRTCPR